MNKVVFNHYFYFEAAPTDFIIDINIFPLGTYFFRTGNGVKKAFKK